MKNILNNIWVLYAIVLGTGLASDSVNLKETIILLGLVGLIHVFVVFISK